jgi:hypothetical protein
VSPCWESIKAKQHLFLLLTHLSFTVTCYEVRPLHLWCNQGQLQPFASWSWIALLLCSLCAPRHNGTMELALWFALQVHRKHTLVLSLSLSWCGVLVQRGKRSCQLVRVEPAVTRNMLG